jgi:hypothetical protein
MVGLLVLGMIALTVGGYIAAWLGVRAPLASALTLGLFWSGANIVVLALAGGAPPWYRVSMPLLGLALAAAGGACRVLGAGATEAHGPSS